MKGKDVSFAQGSAVEFHEQIPDAGGPLPHLAPASSRGAGPGTPFSDRLPFPSMVAAMQRKAGDLELMGNHRKEN